LKVSPGELLNCVDDIKTGFNALKPFRPEGFVEALLYAAVLTKAGDYSTASDCFLELLADIPKEDRNGHWRLKLDLVALASTIEHSIGSGEAFSELIVRWRSLLTDLEKENGQRAKLRDFPPSFFFED
jgi:hypothetical protein